jgi:predicted restriction endonuclease
MSDTKPLFVIKKNLQKSKQTNVYFDQVLTYNVLEDICKKIFQTTVFDVNFVDNKYEDDCLQRGYNIGRLAYLHYKDEIHYITFSEQNPGGRDSSVQSVPPAFERFLTYQINQKRKRCTFHYYFFPGAIQKITEYQKFMYRLMKSSGVHFLNGESLKIKPFLSIDDILLNRKNLSENNQANRSSYITKEDSNHFLFFGKTYGANKYASFMLCYAMSKVAENDQKITFYEMIEKKLKSIPQNLENILKKCRNVNVQRMNESLDKKSIKSSRKIRSHMFLRNLLQYLGDKECAFCECDIPEVIDGAHVWAVASIKKQNITEEKKFSFVVDKNNGMWLCKNHHKIFDSGMISVLNDGQIRIADRIGESKRRFVERITNKTKLDDKYITPEFISYLEKRES